MTTVYRLARPTRILSGTAFAVAPLVGVVFAVATPFVVPDSPVAPDEAVMHLPLTALFGVAYGYGYMLLVGMPVAFALRHLARGFCPGYALAGLLTGALAGLLSGWGAQMVAWGAVAGAVTALAFLALNVGMAPDADRPIRS
jgi:hypothetical protein